MPTNWIIPDKGSIETLLTATALKTADQKLEFNAALARSSKALTMEVNRVRAAIQNAGISPLSVTSGAVPPEGEKHVAAMAINTLISSIPNLASYVISQPGGGKTGLQRAVEEGEAWLKSISEGGPVVPPIDPCGLDYLTAVSDTNPAVSGIAWGDQYGTDAEYAAGVKTNPDGSQTPVEPLDMNIHI